MVCSQTFQDNLNPKDSKIALSHMHIDSIVFEFVVIKYPRNTNEFTVCLFISFGAELMPRFQGVCI